MKEALINYTLHLADNSLILGQRKQRVVGHGPVLNRILPSPIFHLI